MSEIHITVHLQNKKNSLHDLQLVINSEFRIQNSELPASLLYSTFTTVMKKYIFGILVLFFSQFNLGKAQNLVPNGSFENYSQCPFYSNEIYRAIGWFQPHKYPGLNSVNQSSSSDYFNLVTL